MMRFRVLGPLEVWADGKWQPVTAEKWRLLLACLLLRAGQVVSTDTLMDEFWGDVPPVNPKNLISIYVLRLRRLLGDPDGRLLATRAPGYVLHLADGDLDTMRFDSLVADGRKALDDGDPVRAAALLSAGLGLWRGPLLADVQQTPLITAQAERAAEHHLAARSLWAQATIASGRPDEAIAELRGLVGEHQFREGLWALLMRALDGAGRRAEALEAYSQAREVLADELGVDPGPELRRLHADLLAADAAGSGGDGTALAGASRAGAAGGDRRTGTILLGEAPGTITAGPSAGVVPARAAAPAEGPASPPVPCPAQLPADIGDFTGHERHVQYLCDMLTRDGAGGPGAVPVAFVAGAGGLGKTTLAIHAAHQIRDQFPDGQLYVDLLGATPQPLDPGDVLARFLRDLGVPGDKVPAGNDERAALYRTRLTGRRVLIVLDNARDTAQVRPLLPGSASCAALVTTRNRTADLASTRFVDLNVLNDDEALALFGRILGEADSRPADEPEATAELLDACAGLPLAIRICAARLAARSHWRIATMAHRLRDERRRLDELKAGDLAVRASFQVSYDSLHKPQYGADPARAFRLLGLWQGPTISLHAAAALLGEPEPDVAEALESLVDANLLESPDPDWYRFHDLLRFYATERAREEEPEEERATAVARLLGWYLNTADSAADAVAPHRYRVPGDGSEAGPAQAVSSPDEALGWYDSERENLVAAARQAAAAGLHDIAWRLPATLWPFFSRRRSITDCVTTTQIAVASARIAGSRQGEAWALQNLGQALAMIADREALAILEQALVIRREIGDRTGEAQAAVSLTDAYHKIEGADVAYERSLGCLEILRKAGNAPLLGAALVNHGEYSVETGRLDEAAACFQEAYEIWQEVGGYGEGWALHNLGHVHLLSGRLDEAIACLDDAHRLHRASGDLIGQVTALKYLGEAQQDSGNAAAAREAQETALAILEGLRQDAGVADLYASIASLTGEPEDNVAGALETPVDTSHLECPAPEEVPLHDPLRVHAAERAEAELPAQEHDAAIGRQRDWRDREQASTGDGLPQLRTAPSAGTLAHTRTRTSDQPGTPPAWSSTMTGAADEAPAPLTPSASNRDSGPGARRPPDSDPPAHDQQETPGEGHDIELIAMGPTAECAGETAAGAEPGNRAAAEDDLTEDSRLAAADETVLAMLRTILTLRGIVERDQAAAYLTTLARSWPHAPGHAPGMPGKPPREADGPPVPAPAEVIPDAPGHELRPDPLTAKTPADLVRALAQLRQWAGNPTFREMEQRCGHAVGYATICTALGSDKLPSHRVVLAIIAACGGDEKDKRAFTTAWRRLELSREPPRRQGRQPPRGRLYPVPDEAC